MEYELKKFIKDETNKLQSKWRRTHFFLMFVLSLTAFFCEIGMLLFIRRTDFLSTSYFEYFMKYLVIPVLCYSTLNAVVFVILRSKSLSSSFKNYSISLCFAFVCITVSIMHDFFIAVFAGGVIAIIFTAVYSDILLTLITSLVAMVGEEFVGFFNHWDKSVLKNELYKTDLVIFLIIFCTSCFAAISMIIWEKKKILFVAYKQAQINRLKEQVIIDPLTGLHNRRALRIYLDMASFPLFFAMIDVDRFKTINDTWGHSTGDDTLSELGKIIQKKTSNLCHTFRFGGDEFLLAFSGITVEDVMKNCEELRNNFLNSLPEKIRDSGVGLSIGISEYVENDTPHDAINRADKALYTVKRDDEIKIKIL